FLPSCLVVIIGSLAWTTARAQQSFEADKTQVVNAYKNASPGSVGNSNVHLLLNFLDKYADQIQLTPDQRARAENIVRQYRAEKANQHLVDGVPPQGGWFTKLVRAIVVQLGIELASEGIKKATGA
ncbi:hypothetical protein KR054_001514, partial [Drosophila jambulina]